MLPKVFSFWGEVCSPSHGSCLVVGRMSALVCGSHCGSVTRKLLVPFLIPLITHSTLSQQALLPPIDTPTLTSLQHLTRAGDLFPVNQEELD